MAGIAVGRSGGEARSRRANIARYREKSGEVVSRRRDWSSGIECRWESCGREGAGSIEVKSLNSFGIPVVSLQRIHTMLHNRFVSTGS